MLSWFKRFYFCRSFWCSSELRILWFWKSWFL